MTRPIISVRGLSKTYEMVTPVEALKAASFDISGGDQVAIMGRSGSGKSTLLNLLGLLDSPTGGTYVFDGENTDGIGERGRSSIRGLKIGFVFQSFHLMPGRTAAENVELGLLYHRMRRSERRTQSEHAIERVGLGPRASTDVALLSGGERQRVAIARAIVQKPLLLLADEPTGNLDSETGESILQLLKELRTPDFAQVVVTHDEEVASRFARQLRVADGQVHETRLTDG